MEPPESLGRRGQFESPAGVLWTLRRQVLMHSHALGGGWRGCFSAVSPGAGEQRPVWRGWTVISSKQTWLQEKLGDCPRLCPAPLCLDGEGGSGWRDAGRGLGTRGATEV